MIIIIAMFLFLYYKINFYFPHLKFFNKYPFDSTKMASFGLTITTTIKSALWMDIFMSKKAKGNKGNNNN